MPHLVACTHDYGALKREKLIREQVDNTLNFLAQRQKKFIRKLRTGREGASSPHFNPAMGGTEPDDADLEEEDEEEERRAEGDSVWNTTYKMNFNQSNSASAGNPALQLPPIAGRRQFRTLPSGAYSSRSAPAVVLNGPGKLEFAALKSRLASPRGVNIGTLAQQLYPERSLPTKSLVQTSKYDFKLMSPPEKGKGEEQEEALEDVAAGTSTIRFLGLTLPGMEVPIMSRTNSKFKMPDF